MNVVSVLEKLNSIPQDYKLYVSQLSCLKGYKCDELETNFFDGVLVISSSDFYTQHLSVGEVC